MSLNPSKAIGPNSIPTKILKLLINDVWSQLIEIFSLSFSRGVNALILKTGKVIPVYKKDSKSVLITAKYPCYRILTKYLKDLCTIGYITFQK